MLLGEAGAGKTTALDQAIERIRAAGHLFARVDLGSFGDEMTLRDRVRRASRDATPERPIVFFFDGLDETRLGVETAAKLIPDELLATRLESAAFRVRVTCRTGALPESLLVGLARIWPREVIRTCEIEVLRQSDLPTALSAYGVAPQPQLLEKLTTPRFAPLAARPITLLMLVRELAQGRELPDSARELYARTLRALCEDPDSGRRASAKLNPQERQALARRLAAVTLLCGRPRVRVGGDFELEAVDSVAIDEVSGGVEPVDALRDVAVAPDGVREVVVCTQLFPAPEKSDAPPPVTWFHRSYAEFLAAERVARYFPGAEGLRWLTVSGAKEGRVVPQFRGITAWLASMSAAVFDHLLAHDPEVLLRADPAALDDAQRRALIDAVLALDDKAEAIPWWHPERFSLAAFAHATTDDQLRAWITDKGRNVRARVAATRAVLDLPWTNLAETVVSVALDATDEMEVRVDAARIVSRFGSLEDKRRLLELARGTAEDTRDQLKGVALDALWPTEVSPERRFRWLEPPQDSHFFGAYEHFVSVTLPERLNDEDLRAALAWMSQSVGPRSEWPPETTRAGVLRKVAHALDRPEVLDALASYVTACVRADEDVLPTPLVEAIRARPDTNALRMKLFQRVVSALDEEGSRSLWWYFRSLFDRHDLSGLIEQLLAMREGPGSSQVARIILEVYRTPKEPAMPEQTEALYSVALRSKALWEVTRPLWEGTPLDDDMVRYTRERVRVERDRERRVTEAEGARRREIERYLLAAEQRDLAAWWNFVAWVNATIRSDGTVHRALRVGIHTTDFWKSADGDTKERLTQAAADYLDEADPATTQWFAQEAWHWPAMAGRAALALLAVQDPARLDALSGAVWARWCVVLLDPPWSDGDGSRDLREELLRRAFARVPREVRENVLALLDRENATHGRADSLRGVGVIEDAALLDALFARINQGTLGPDAFETTLLILMRARRDPSVHVALRTIHAGWGLAGVEGELADRAARVLLARAPEEAWSVLEARVTQDPMRGAAIVQGAEGRSRDPRWRPAFTSPRSMASFYRWAARALEDGRTSTHARPRGTVSAEDVLRWALPRIRDDLVELGTREAVEEVERLIEAFPQDDSLRTALRLAQDRHLDRAWRPWPVGDVRDWTRDVGATVQRLRGALASVINDVRQIRRFVHDAGLSPGEVDFQGAAVLVWQNVIEVAQRHHKLRDLLQNIVHEYPSLGPDLDPISGPPRRDVTDR